MSSRRVPESAAAAQAAGLGLRLVDWYRGAARRLPWRGTTDPYAIWVSEVMLQQTGVKVVAPRWQEFLRAWPDVTSLAAADEASVLGSVQGMGYYRRFRAMKRAAEAVVCHHGGVLPRDRDGWARLPGVGAYTAGAVASIAFNEPVAAVDGNVSRVVSRLFCLEGDVTRSSSRRDIELRVLAMMPPGAARDFNQALFDLGAGICTPRAPACLACPLGDGCEARRRGVVDRFPSVRRRAAPVDIVVAVAALESEGRLLCVRRAVGAARMPGFWELPEVWIADGAAPEQALAALLEERLGVAAEIGELLATARHTITRHRLDCRLWAAHVASERMPEGEDIAWWTRAELESAAFPASTISRKLLRR